MATKTTKLHCNECPDGIVRLIVKSVRGTISMAVKDCDKCGNPHGLKSIQKLKEVGNG